MTKKNSKSELKAIEGFSAGEVQSAEETFDNLCFFLENLLKVFPDNEFGRLNSFYSIPSIRKYLYNINREWGYCSPADFSQGELADLKFTLHVLENFMVEEATEYISGVVTEAATYFASINLSINLSGKINFRLNEDGDLAPLHCQDALYYEMYLNNIAPIIKSIELSPDSFLEYKAARKSMFFNRNRNTKSLIEGTLTLSDTLLVMKTIHTTGFVIGSFPKVQVSS